MSARMVLFCPECKEQLSVPASKKNERVKCPTCGHERWATWGAGDYATASERGGGDHG